MTSQEIHAGFAQAYLQKMRCPAPTCGLKADEHAASVEQIKATGQNCALLSNEVDPWWLGRDGKLA